MGAQRDKVIETNSEFIDKLEPLLNIFDNEELVQKLKGEKHFTLDFLKENYGVSNLFHIIFFYL